MTHSPEPWRNSTTKITLPFELQPQFFVYGNGAVRTVVAMCGMFDSAERIVACVNAMAGIERPVDFMKQLGRVMMRSGGISVMRNVPMEMLGFVEELAKLKEIQEFEEFT